MKIEKINITINNVTYECFENKNNNYDRCYFCEFYNGKCYANKDIIKICNIFNNIYWQSIIVSINNNINNNFTDENDYIIIDMINELKKERIYNESI